MKHVKFYEEDSSIGRIYRESGMVEAGQRNLLWRELLRMFFELSRKTGNLALKE